MKAKVITCIIAVLLLTGCSQNTEVPKTENITYPAADTSGMNVTYIDTGKNLVPISLIRDGNTLLSGENYYYNIENAVNNDDTLGSKKYTSFSHDGKNEGETVLDSRPKEEALITSGNWQLCPDMRYTKFGNKDKVNNEYIQFIAQALPDVYKSAEDVTVSDIWEYDLDGDSANEAIIRINDDSGTLLALMSTTLGNCILDSTDGQATPYIADLDGDGEFSVIVISGGSFKRAVIYKEKSCEPEYTVYLPLE